MARGYIRVSKAGPSRAEQAAALARHVEDMKHGCYVDAEKGARPAEMPLVQRDIAVKGLRAGDVLAVACADRLGRGRGDLQAVLVEITRRGAAVLDCETGTLIRGVEGLADAVAFIERAEDQARRRRGQKMAATRKAMGISGGRPKVLATPAKLAKAKAIWSDLSLTAAQAAAAVSEAVGEKIAPRTLYSKFPKVRRADRPGG